MLPQSLGTGKNQWGNARWGRWPEGPGGQADIQECGNDLMDCCWLGVRVEVEGRSAQLQEASRGGMGQS